MVDISACWQLQRKHRPVLWTSDFWLMLSSRRSGNGDCSETNFCMCMRVKEKRFLLTRTNSQEKMKLAKTNKTYPGFSPTSGTWQRSCSFLYLQYVFSFAKRPSCTALKWDTCVEEHWFVVSRDLTIRPCYIPFFFVWHFYSNICSNCFLFMIWKEF